MITIPYHEFEINLFDDPDHSLNSADNHRTYGKEYFDGSLNQDRVNVSTKHAIVLKKDGIELASAIICETGSGISLHKQAFQLTDNQILLCCSDYIYSLHLPDLEFQWKKRQDPSVCFGIHSLGHNFLVHGELTITCIDRSGNELWNFHAPEIFVNPEASEQLIIQNNRVKIKDWDGVTYILDEDGKLLEQINP